MIQIDNRILFEDGDFIIPSSDIEKFIDEYGYVNGLCTDEITKDIKEYNKLTDASQQILVKTNLKPIECKWNIPDKYKDINVYQYLTDKLYNEIQMQNKSVESDWAKIRIKRIIDEFHLYKKYEMISVLQLMIYIVDTFESNNLVWGIGRGSSVSSYILYLIGIHDIDSIKFDLDITDFLHE